MVGRISALDGSGTAIHLTFLDGDTKADIEPAKIIIGPARGGAVHLAEPRGALAVAEGIETAASVMQSTGIPTWASLSTSLMRCLKLPPSDKVLDLYIAADGDKPGRDAAAALAARAQAQGYRVHIVPAPDGLDWNDLIREAAA